MYRLRAKMVVARIESQGSVLTRAAADSPMAIQDLDQAIKAEQQKRNRRARALTPEERMDRYLALQSLAEQTLATNPVALAAFHRRNLQKRTAARVRELALRLLRYPDSQDALR
jgi:hypothetical protein